MDYEESMTARRKPVFAFKRVKEGTPRVELSSGCEEYPGCTLTIGTRKSRITINLPQIVKPFRQWVDTSKYAWSTNPKGGYWEVHPNRYGFYLHNNHFYVSLGAQTHDSRTTKKWSCFLPWGEWRHTRISFYDTEGKQFWSHESKRDIRGFRIADERYKAQEACPKVRFAFTDYDGEIIGATTHIQEHEWKRGEKWCSWLSLFYQPRVRRSLDIAFDKETGGQKGSYKGGIMGTSIDMLPGELHEAAFIRYCEKNNMEFEGKQK